MSSTTTTPRTSPGGWIVGTFCGLTLLVAGVGSWWFVPWLTAVLVGVAVVVMSVWQWFRRSREIAPVSSNPWLVVGVPVLFGGLAVLALNGWIMQVSRGADGGGSSGGESGMTQMTVGFVTGVIFMAGAYGYGRVRAQRVQVTEQRYGEPVAETPDEDDDVDPNEWLQNFDRRAL
ncbi:MAG: hypothetical protein QM809_15480 [Gordonia sp. (in: high G+C Gram-positive bacteria)]|uniref:hypothetical protein n=1 Tax=Gordonia sp. (in: high G+C Gram-positive bacteria) TaxID=84139 RepID=UPI0039E3E01D